MYSLTKTLLAISLLVINRQRDNDLLVQRNTFQHNYDYIVVGAGSAGSVVASRLTENPDISVLLVEAGGAAPVVSDMPAMTPTLWGSDIDWRIPITPQKHSHRAFTGQSAKLSQGKVIGGSSIINAMAYARGFVKDYDDWELEFGANGWNWTQVLPYFKRSENNTNHSLNRKYHGFDGLLSVTSIDEPRPINKLTISAAQELGYNVIDFNDPNTEEGVAIQQMTLKDGSRFSSAKAFLWPARDRPNLHIMAKSLVTKINFDDNRRAISVDILSNENKHLKISARHEIIVCAGALNTPKLLMLSGIGFKQHLIDHQIPVVSDLPVGDNFHDTPVTFGVHFRVNQSLQSPDLLQSDVSDYFLKGKGRLTQFEKAAIRMKTSAAIDDRPDMQIFVETGSWANFPDADSAAKALNIKPEIWNQYYRPYSGQSTITFILLLNRPLSRGTVRLKSNDFYDNPIVNPNYYDNKQDIQSMVEGIKIAWNLGHTKLFRDSLDAKPFVSPLPGCPAITDSVNKTDGKHLMPNNEYFECLAKTLTITYTHLAGTCRMGADTDPAAVVTNRLKVRNVTGLRVVDSSVAPQVPSGAFYSSVLMIADRGSDLILEDYNNSS
ncbi:glucose dehydrogenase [FAD, quinone]-like, partial [Oppia nitens]|uniref:glucose dehydrogenase [FAD, quinone]-like n=1 Tax=Oppia nitens TaxID=1686743 RepID=UPI0023DB5AB7